MRLLTTTAATRTFVRAHTLFALSLMMAALLVLSCNKRSGKPRVLVFSKTTGWHHESIPAGIAAIQKLGNENGFEVDTTTNSGLFVEDTLKKYSAVVFLNTTEDVLNSRQEAAFERYIQAGGGFAGVHSATDTEYDWRWYGRLVGAYFGGHPQIQDAVLHVADSSFVATKGLPKEWKRKDEWYNFKWMNKDVHTLMTIDETSYQGGTNGAQHPMAWYHEFDGGRAFYTALGHTDESYSDPLFLKHLLGGIQYAIGDNIKLDYGKAKTGYAPDEDRFVKTTLVEGTFSEPTEMTVLPNLDVLIAQRRGEIMWYSGKTKAVKQAGFLNVYYQTNTPGVNAEEGVLGIAADPDFSENNYVYIYYSPIDTSVNRLSRFEFKNDTIDTRSEKVILQFYSQREICCHTGGSIAFGADHLLYLSTGDNSTPFDEPKQPYASHGFAPLDDRPGHIQYDSRRTAGNTADLRGKILRLKINADGSYSIPQGNLFPTNNPKARPEIFVMGDRNPYRISVDKKTGFLYWGEVGPDSNVDSLDVRGPRGYDEVNQARKAGFFGWPLFIGNNFAYRQYDYATGRTGNPFDPAKPINASRNNTGLQELPPAQPAFIWYPYGPSKDFPSVGTGGRTAMAGPVYYPDAYPKENRYPDYYNGKLFIYEWMRNWIKVVTMQPNGDYDKMEPFMEHTAFHAPIDMEAGPDGRIYVLEYGSGWFSKNPDAGLSRIDYISGNRPPKVDSLTVNRESGGLPYTVVASVKAKDPENDELHYVWHVGANKIETKVPQLQYTIKQAGEYPLSVDVIDENNASNKSNEITVYAGNEQPDVDITVQGNRSFYFPGKPVAYNVVLKDIGDKVDTANLLIATQYIEGANVEEEKQGHQQVSANIMGKSIMLSLDCKSCHKVDEKSIGPAFTQVAQRYKKDEKAAEYLQQKIIKGGSGAWGETAMPAHPTLKPQDAQQIVQWVLSLSNEKAKTKSLPANGTIMPQARNAKDQKTVLSLSASYTDNGSAGVRPLSDVATVNLRSNQLDVSALSGADGFEPKDSAGSIYGIFPSNSGWLKVARVDFTGIKSIELVGYGAGAPARYTIEVHLDGVNGQKIATGEIAFATGKQKNTAVLPVQVLADNRFHDVYIVCRKVGTEGGARPLLKNIVFAPGDSAPANKAVVKAK